MNLNHLLNELWDDNGLFLSGDRDFIPLIEAIKDTGKKLMGFSMKKYFRKN